MFNATILSAVPIPGSEWSENYPWLTTAASGTGTKFCMRASCPGLTPAGSQMQVSDGQEAARGQDFAQKR